MIVRRNCHGQLRKLLVILGMMPLLSTWVVLFVNWTERKDMLKLSEEVLRLKHGPGLKVVWHSAVPRFPILARPVARSNGASRNDVIARPLKPRAQPCQWSRLPQSLVHCE